MLELLKDPSERIFCEKEKDKYLPLQTLFKVKDKIIWKKSENMIITPTVKQILKFSKVHFEES
jgi:hypothetical protein